MDSCGLAARVFGQTGHLASQININSKIVCIFALFVSFLQTIPYLCKTIRQHAMNIYDTIFSDFKSGLLASFYDTMYAELLAYASRLLGADFAFLSEDCVQNAVYKTYGKNDQLTDSVQWRNHLYLCVHNEAMSLLRKGKASSRYIASLEQEIDDLLCGIIEQETITMLYDAINRLPEKYREIFRMSFVEGMKNDEAAQTLGIATITYKKRKAHMIDALRHDLKGENGERLISLLLLLS